MAEVKLTITDRSGKTRTLAAAPGATLMQVLRDQVDLTIGTCGGAMSCGTCLVKMSAEWQGRLAAPSDYETEMLDALGADGQSRLACQIVLEESFDGLTAAIAPAA